MTGLKKHTVKTLNAKTQSEFNSTGMYEELQNGDESVYPKNNVHSSDLVPSVSKVTDMTTKTYSMLSVALKLSPIMMCFINHAPVPIILDTEAENNVIGDETCRTRFEILLENVF